MTKFQLVLPERSQDALSNGLRAITRRLLELGYEWDGGLLGGPDGYGVAYENETFMMHPFCWCERCDCPWCRGCECEGYMQDDGTKYGTWVTTRECDCCKESKPRAPNFHHKSSGLKVWWYKWIGRSMEWDAPETVTVEQIIAECLNSCTAPGK